MVSTIIGVAINTANYLAWGIAAAALFFWGYRKWENRKMLSKRIEIAHAHLMKAPKVHRLQQNIYILKFIKKMEERADIAGLQWSFKFYLVLCLILCGVGIYVGIYFFSSFKLALLLGAIGLIAPDQIINFGVQNEKQKIDKQLLSAVEIFATEYNDVQNIQMAFTETYPQLPQPVRSLFETTSRRLNNGEHYIDVFDDLAKHLQINFGRIFCNICISCYEDSNTSKMYDYLQGKIAQRVIRERENKTHLFTPKLYAIGLLFLSPILFFVNIQLQPETYYLFTQTAQGKSILTYAIVCAIFGVIVNKALSKVGD
jgi:Flp pilus assembly protein TadB